MKGDPAPLYVVPLWMFFAALGAIMAVSICIHAYVVYRFRGLDKESRALSVQMAQHKSKMEENTFSNRALKNTLEQLFGKPTNGG